MAEQTETRKRNLYDKIYKKILVFPAIALIITLVFLFSFYFRTGDIMNKDISLTGGTSITIYAENNIAQLKTDLSGKLDDLNVRQISDLRTRKQIAFIIETRTGVDEAKSILENYLGLELTEENSSIEFTGSSLSEGFYSQLRIALIIAFVLMSIVVFVLFRTFIPSFAVVLSAFADIAMTTALVDILGIKLSTAGIVALLMLIGYSVDSDILLTTRLLRKREEYLNKRLWDAFKTGITMTLTSLVAVAVSLAIVFNFSSTLRQIFTILTIGLAIDIFNTWITNASILKWYCEKKGIE